MCGRLVKLKEEEVPISTMKPGWSRREGMAFVIPTRNFLCNLKGKEQGAQ